MEANIPRGILMLRAKLFARFLGARTDQCLALINLHCHAIIATVATRSSGADCKADERRPWQKSVASGSRCFCCFAVIPLFSWLLFLPLCRQRTRVSAGNQV